jgi:hypothetical protein
MSKKKFECIFMTFGSRPPERRKPNTVQGVDTDSNIDYHVEDGDIGFHVVLKNHVQKGFLEFCDNRRVVPLSKHELDDVGKLLSLQLSE